MAAAIKPRRFHRQHPQPAIGSPRTTADTTGVPCADFCPPRSACLIFRPAASAQTAEEFYKGKIVNLVIGFSVGGGYDLYARHLARTSASTSRATRPWCRRTCRARVAEAANYIYTAAPKDGTYFGTFARTTGINPLLESGATFDGTKFSWLGSVTDDVSTCVTWNTTAVKTWDDFLKKPSTLGGQGPSSEPDIFARLYKNVFGAPIKLVPGYPGTNEISLAMERGEVDGLCGLSWSTIKTRHAQWLKEKKMNMIVQASFKKVPELADVPLHGADQGHREAANPETHPRGAGDGAAVRAPPGVPADRKAALVNAFDATMKDPDYLADAKRLDIDVNPVSGKELDELLAELYATPKDVVKKAGEAITK